MAPGASLGGRGREDPNAAPAGKARSQHQQGEVRDDEEDDSRGTPKRGAHASRAHLRRREETQRQVRRFNPLVHGRHEAGPRGSRRDSAYSRREARCVPGQALNREQKRGKGRVATRRCSRCFGVGIASPTGRPAYIVNSCRYSERLGEGVPTSIGSSYTSRWRCAATRSWSRSVVTSPMYPLPVAPMCSSTTKTFSAGSMSGRVGFTWLESTAKSFVFRPSVVDPRLTAWRA